MKKPNDTYSIRFLISYARTTLICYDLHDLFNVAKVKSDGKNEIYFFEQAQLLIEFVMFQFNLNPFIMKINIAC